MSATKQRIRSQSEAAGFPLTSVVILGAASAIVVATEPEQQAAAEAWLANTLDWSDAAELAWVRGVTAALLDAKDDVITLLRGTVAVTMDEVNDLRQWVMGFKAAVAGAGTLAALKTAVAALPNTPDRTLAQARTAVKNKVTAGLVED